MKPSTEATSGDLPSYKVPQNHGPDLVQYEFPFVSDLPEPDQSMATTRAEEELQSVVPVGRPPLQFSGVTAKPR